MKEEFFSHLNSFLFFFKDCTGGSTCFFLASYSYISDVSDPKTRTRRFAFLDGLFPLGFYIGNSLSALTKAKFGFMFNFGLGMLFSLIAMAYTLIFVRDSRKERAIKLVQQRKETLEELETEEERIQHLKDWKKHGESEFLLFILIFWGSLFSIYRKSRLM